MLHTRQMFTTVQSRLAALGRTAKQGLFGNLLLTAPHGFFNLAELVERKSINLVQNIIRRDPTVAAANDEPTTVALIDDLSNEICCAADLTDCVRSMHCDPAYAKSAEESMRKYTILVETLNTTPELYRALKNSLTAEEELLDEVSLRTANLLIEDFQQSGVHLEAQEREKFVNLSEDIFKAGARFISGVDDPVALTTQESRLHGIQANLLEGPWSGSADYSLRRFTYGKYFQHVDKQEAALSQLVGCRDQLAKLTGFPSFAHRAQSHTILQTYDNVHSFLTQAIEGVTPMLPREVDSIRELLSVHSRNFNAKEDLVGEWDVDFAAAVERQSIYAKLGHISDFFHFDSLLAGFEMLMGHLYGVSFSRMFPAAGEIWPGNVLKLNVYTAEGSLLLGTIFLDVDTRPGKVQGDCHYTVRCSKLTPVVVLSLSLVPPELQHQKTREDVFDSITVSPSQAENFFHEMGHAIHSMLGRTRFQHVAGTRCPTDFAEVPSHLMECFFNDPRVLERICRDKSGRHLHRDQAAALVSARKLFSVTRVLQQALYALFDLQVHGPYAKDVGDGKLSTTELFHKYAAVALPGFEMPVNYAYHHRIPHLVTYGGKYYSYLIARVCALLIYEKLFAKDPFSRQDGMRWAEVQSHGGEYESHFLLEKVLGKTSLSTDKFVEVLKMASLDGTGSL